MSEETKVAEAQASSAQIYFEEKQIADVQVLPEKTPLGDTIYEVTFANGFGDPMKMASKKYTAMRTMEKSDATTARDSLVKKIGADLYALMMEYGLKFSEIDPTLNEVVRLVNDAQNAAIDHLWGNHAHFRSMLDVNRVLLEKYESEKAAPAEQETPAADDGAAPAGSPVDNEAPKQV